MKMDQREATCAQGNKSTTAQQHEQNRRPDSVVKKVRSAEWKIEDAVRAYYEFIEKGASDTYSEHSCIRKTV